MKLYISFVDYCVKQKRHVNTFLDKIDRLIDWRPIERLLKQKYKKQASADGRPAYPALPMFKLLLLQRWYNLSDPGMEEALKRCYHFVRMRYKGLAKGNMELILNSMAFNLKKAVVMVE